MVDARGGGKTRNAPAHGPLAAKKAFKAGSTINPTKRAGFAAPPPGSPAAFTNKRKADESVLKPEEPEKARVPSTLLNTPEEIDFPRGGGTNLTQVEVREAQLEGEKEARDEDEVRTLLLRPAGRKC